jgi:hypothetical protein
VPRAGPPQAAGYLRGQSAYQRREFGNSFDVARAYVDRDNREALRAVGSGEADGARRGGEEDVAVKLLRPVHWILDFFKKERTDSGEESDDARGEID